MNLETLAAALTLPGLPAWTGGVALAAIALLALCFLLMPFSIFGLRSRLEGLEAQLDEMQAELRAIAARLAAAPMASPVARGAAEHGFSATRAPMSASPPPAPAHAPMGRQEPRLSWPREGS